MGLQRDEDLIRNIQSEVLRMSVDRVEIKKITSAQLLAIRATPIVIVPKSKIGPNRAIVPVTITFHKPAGTAYTLAVDRDLGVRYTDGAGNILTVLETTGFLDQATVQRRLLTIYGTAGAGTPAGALVATPTENADLVLHNLGAAELTLGTSPLYVVTLWKEMFTTFAF